MLTDKFIQDRLTSLAAERAITLRYANESGSRAWGLASTDSDYDVRFVYQHPRDWYLQLGKPKDMIGPIMELGGELDLAGWDLRKVLSHLASSNAGVIEWLYSPVQYHVEADFLAQLRELATAYFRPRKVAAHYLGIARSAQLAGFDEAANNWNLKKYFYYVRPLLAARYVMDTERWPPVAFADFKNEPSVQETLNELSAHKQTVAESYRMVIPASLAKHFSELEGQLNERLPSLPRVEHDLMRANATFRGLIGY
ncbi:MAG: nucleotidyltransferase domain-containing protein [Bacteroidota bacterium]